MMSDNYDSGFDLVLSDYERGYLIAYYESDAYIQNEHSGRDSDDMEWYGVQVGDRMFDLCVWKDEDTNKIVCTVYECDWINDNWQTNCRHSWTLTEEYDDE